MYVQSFYKFYFSVYELPNMRKTISLHLQPFDANFIPVLNDLLEVIERTINIISFLINFCGY